MIYKNEHNYWHNFRSIRAILVPYGVIYKNLVLKNRWENGEKMRNDSD